MAVQRSASGSGSAALPLTMRRSGESARRSCADHCACTSAGCLSKSSTSRAYTVGTAMKRVTEPGARAAGVAAPPPAPPAAGGAARSRQAQVAAASNRGSISQTAPMYAALSWTATMPCTWCSGSTLTMRSSGVQPQADVSACSCASSALMATSTPFGRPVVPLV